MKRTKQIGLCDPESTGVVARLIEVGQEIGACRPPAEQCARPFARYRHGPASHGCKPAQMLRISRLYRQAQSGADDLGDPPEADAFVGDRVIDGLMTPLSSANR